MKNRLLAQLDRRLERRGEDITLHRQVGTTTISFVEANVPAIIRVLTVAQLVGNITQTNFFIILSPTHLLKQQWPGGRTPPATGGIITPVDVRVPTVNDKVYVRGSQKAINRVAPVFDAGECIRIELTVLG
jgi:hypothetical protein